MSWSNTGERGWAYRGETPMSSVNDLTLEALLHERENLIQERDEAIAKAATYERDWYEVKSEFGTAAAKLRERVRMLQAEVEMLRGVGCRETKEGEPESGPCGVCLLCAEERGARWALDIVFDSMMWPVSAWTERDVCREARKRGAR